MLMIVIMSNITLGNVRHANSNIRNVLFPLFGIRMKDIHSAWRVAMLTVWLVPWKTHNNRLHHLMDPELCIKLIICV